jgi:8-oxo-dGTP pyrophosphatase MutT (NUDIX family)
MAEPLDRTAGRVLVLDSAGRVLLFEGIDPGLSDGPRFWFTPGGGCEGGESFEAAARRELAEETGLAPERLDGPVHERVAVFDFEGVTFRQSEQFFLARVEVSGEEVAIVSDGFTDVERRAVLGHRWWSVEELRSSTADIYPEQLADLLDGLAAIAC